MSLSTNEIEFIKENLLDSFPLAGPIAITNDYWVDNGEFDRQGVSAQDYCEWNLTYLLLVLESEGV